MQAVALATLPNRLLCTCRTGLAGPWQVRHSLEFPQAPQVSLSADGYTIASRAVVRSLAMTLDWH